MLKRIALALAAALAFCATAADLAHAQQAYDPGGKARVSNYCTTTTPGDTKCPAGSSASPVYVAPSQRTIVTLDVKTVTTGATAVNALSAGHRTAGGFLQNPVGATVALCINEIGTASGTTSSGDTTCIQPGQSYTVAPAAGAVSVVTSDSSHPFSGYGLQ